MVEDGNVLLSSVVASSAKLQAQYGGVVPELAARSHIEVVNSVVQQALDDAECGWDDIDAIAVTYGPGLGGSLLVGVLTARTLAIVHNKPLYAVNHVEAHVYSNFLTKVKGSRQAVTPTYNLPAAQPTFPLLALVVSGGHTQLVLFRDHHDYTLLGQTHDDAIGEAFDKVAKILGLPYPGGPGVERLAREGDATAYHFPKARLAHISPGLQALRDSKHKTREATIPHSAEPKATSPTSRLLPYAATHSYDFSFSGLKTAVLRAAQQAVGADHTLPSKDLPQRLSEAHKANIAASFTRVAFETVVDKTLAAYAEFCPTSVVIAGGVAASPELRRQLSKRLPCPIEYTDARLCTDNAAMIATLGYFHAARQMPVANAYTLDIHPNLSM